MKNVIAKIILFSLTLLLCSCAAPPDGLQEYDYKSSYFSEQDSDQKIALSVLRNNKNEILSEMTAAKYDNISFQLVNELYVPEEIGVYKICCIDGFQENADLLFNHYVPSEILESCEIVNDPRYYPTGPYIKKDGFYCSVGCTGFFSLSMNDKAVNAMLSPNIADSVYIGTKSWQDENLELSPDKIADMVDSFSNELSALAGYPTKYSTQSISVYYGENDEHFYCADIKCEFNKVRLFDIAPNTRECELDIASFCGASAVIDDSGVLCNFTIQNSFEKSDTIEAVDEIISPVAAAKIFSEKLSAELSFDVVGMELVYIPTHLGDETSIRSGTELLLTPYWLFVIDTMPQQEIFGLVNCIDGDVEFVKNG